MRVVGPGPASQAAGRILGRGGVVVVVVASLRYARRRSRRARTRARRGGAKAAKRKGGSGSRATRGTVVKRRTGGPAPAGPGLAGGGACRRGPASLSLGERRWGRRAPPRSGLRARPVRATARRGKRGGSACGRLLAGGGASTLHAMHGQETGGRLVGRTKDEILRAAQNGGLPTGLVLEGPGTLGAPGPLGVLYDGHRWQW